MGYFPDVLPGENFVPSALLSNNLRRMVNTLDGFKAGRVSVLSGGQVKIQVYNAINKDIEASSAVNFVQGGAFSDTAIPACPLIDETKPWGIVPQLLSASQIGDCIISGPVLVQANGSGDFALPSRDNPAIFQLGSSGEKVLFASEGKALLNLGATREYEGPFKVSYSKEEGEATVKGGYFFVNLASFQIGEKTVPVTSSGFVLLSCFYAGESISSPEISFAQSLPLPEYKKCDVALAKITISGSYVNVEQFQYGNINTVIWGNCEEDEEEGS